MQQEKYVKRHQRFSLRSPSSDIFVRDWPFDRNARVTVSHVGFSGVLHWRL